MGNIRGHLRHWYSSLSNLEGAITVTAAGLTPTFTNCEMGQKIRKDWCASRPSETCLRDVTPSRRAHSLKKDAKIKIPENGHVPVGRGHTACHGCCHGHAPHQSNFCGWSRLKMDAGRFESKQRSARGLLDNLTLPRPSTSLAPLRPSASSYRPQWSSSPPTSPGFGSSRTPDVRHSMRPTYRLPSFRATFGRMPFDPHLSDDEAPPSSDFGYNHSEYDYSDPGTPDDRLPSVPVDSPPPEDVLFDRPRRVHRHSVSSEHEEEAILGLLDLRRRPRVSSFASDISAPDLVSTISPETEHEPSLFPMTPDRSSIDPVDHHRVKIEEEVRDLWPHFFLVLIYSIRWS